MRGPGKVLLFASASGWIVLACLLAGDPPVLSATAIGHGGHAGATAAWAPAPAALSTTMWLTMLIAMAPLLLIREVGRLWRASLRRRRHPTIVLFLGGYVGVWLLVGVALTSLSGWVGASAGRIAGTIALVVVVFCSPARQRALNACHRVPTLRVFGTAALWDALRYGIATGRHCAAACGPAMLLALVATEHHLIGMAIVTIVATVERYQPARRPVWRFPGRGRRIS
jgi:predicted metal-binding membrane protein